jgi:flavodoxin
MLPACTKAQSPLLEAQEALNNKKTLIVYLSRTSNTKAVAEIIHEQVGGTVVALELETPYPEDYKAIVAQVDSENETGYLPPLKTKIENIQEYDTVFLGFPTWDMQLPPPMKSFLNENDLSGKTVIPFNTNGGYGVGSSLQTVKDLSPGANILEGFSIKGGLERDGILLAIKGERREEIRAEVMEWLQSIQVL